MSLTTLCVDRPAQCSLARLLQVLLQVFMLSSVSHAAVQAAEPVLTLAEAQRLALARSHQLTAHDHAAATAREMAAAARQLPDPVLKAGIDNLPVNGADRLSLTGDFMTMRRIGIAQEWTRAEKRQARGDRFVREAEQAAAQKQASTAAIQREVAIAWLERYFLETMVRLVDAQILQGRQEIQAAEGAFRAGRGSQADVLAARLALASVEDRASDLGRRLRNSGVMLARWTGRKGEPDLAGKPAMATVRLASTVLEKDLYLHPQIGVLSRRAEVAAAEARMAQTNKQADWNIELTYQQRGPAYTNMVSVGVSIPLQWDQQHRQDRELAAKLFAVEQAKAERDEALRRYVAETHVMVNEWENGKHRLERYQRELIPLAASRTQAELATYGGGKSSLAGLLAARRSELELRLQALQLEADTARIWAQLNFLLPDAGIVPATMNSSTHKDTQ